MALTYHRIATLSKRPEDCTRACTVPCSWSPAAEAWPAPPPWWARRPCGRGRGGSDCLPVEVQPAVATVEPSYMTYPLENDPEGQIRFKLARTMLGRFSNSRRLAIGPGLGQSDEIRELIQWWSHPSRSRRS